MMKRSTRLIVAALLASGIAGPAAAMLQADTSAELRATGQVGEQWDGYMGVVGSAPPALVARMNALNIKRRAYYTELASQRSAKIEEVGAAMACDIFRDGVRPGQYYRLPDRIWRQRDSAPVPLPAYCG